MATVDAEVTHIRTLSGQYVVGVRLYSWTAEDNVTGGCVVNVRRGAEPGPGGIAHGAWTLDEARGIKAALDAWFAAHPEVKP